MDETTPSMNPYRVAILRVENGFRVLVADEPGEPVEKEHVFRTAAGVLDFTQSLYVHRGE